MSRQLDQLNKSSKREQHNRFSIKPKKEQCKVYNGKPGETFTLEHSGATYEVQKNGSFRRIS